MRAYLNTVLSSLDPVRVESFRVRVKINFVKEFLLCLDQKVLFNLLISIGKQRTQSPNPFLFVISLQIASEPLKQGLYSIFF